MSYSKNVTYIEDLPDLDDLEPHTTKPYGSPIQNQLRESKYPGTEMFPPGESEKFNKFIRPGHKTHPMAGMEPMNMPNKAPPPTPISEEYGESMSQVGMIVPKYHLPPGSPSCIDVANHVEVCPICNRYYNNDKSVYIIAIIVLTVICILLLKRVLNS